MAKSKDKKNKTNTGNPISRFFTGVATEIKRIRWPKFSELVADTGRVLAFCVLFAIFFVLCDLVISNFLIMIGVGR
ncbi:MAG: preprotein translocase subunit SecE [Bacillota bacterium]|jgi:preprotein translocase SecE subunit|nr:preprotein translocase subunit SecE [Bacillota bacterium]NLL26062.1 preprotein translocase subunit SecE [Erysipelotrichia bacterium]